MLIFRNPHLLDYNPSPQEMQESMAQWQNWIGGIAAQEKFVSTNALGTNGKTLKADLSVTDGPFAEVKEFVGGYLVLKAENIDEAVELSRGCPILQFGGSVEVRDIMVFDL